MPQYMYDIPRWAARDAQMRKLGVVIPGIVQKDYLGELYRGITDAAIQRRCTLVTKHSERAAAGRPEHVMGQGWL